MTTTQPWIFFVSSLFLNVAFFLIAVILMVAPKSNAKMFDLAMYNDCLSNNSLGWTCQIHSAMIMQKVSTSAFLSAWAIVYCSGILWMMTVVDLFGSHYSYSFQLVMTALTHVNTIVIMRSLFEVLIQVGMVDQIQYFGYDAVKHGYEQIGMGVVAQLKQAVQESSNEFFVQFKDGATWWGPQYSPYWLGSIGIILCGVWPIFLIAWRRTEKASTILPKNADGI